MKHRWKIKLLKYEYWPMWAFYGPLLPYIILKGIRNRNLFYFTNANPGIDKYGGFFFDSKQIIDEQIPQIYRPQTISVELDYDFSKLLEIIKIRQFQYPLILKPDAGERGKGVVKINSEDELYNGLKFIEGRHLLQEYINFTSEYGVFVVYVPSENKYRVSSLTEKQFFNVTGNGTSSIQELILAKERGIVYSKQISERSFYPLDYIPYNGEFCMLHTFGNHCNGAEFINRNNWISSELDENFDVLMKDLKGIYFGRFDIKVTNFDNLLKFEQIKIIEFNGVTAEPTHIYDNSFGYLKALRAFIDSWKYLDDISKFNLKNGVKPASFVETSRKIIGRYKQ